MYLNVRQRENKFTRQEERELRTWRWREKERLFWSLCRPPCFTVAKQAADDKQCVPAVSRLLMNLREPQQQQRLCVAYMFAALMERSIKLLSLAFSRKHNIKCCLKWLHSDPMLSICTKNVISMYVLACTNLSMPHQQIVILLFTVSI